MNQPQRIRIDLSARDRELILRHGYPLDGIKDRLERLASSDEPAQVDVSRFELDRLLGDLAHKIDDRDDEILASELDDLYERLEVTLRSSRRTPLR